MKTHTLFCTALMLAAAHLAGPLTAADNSKDYPNRPIRMLVPNAPGSSVDTLSRIIGAKLAEVLGQQVDRDRKSVV